MDTELLILFNAQWHGIRDVVLSEAKRQMAAGGKVDARRLTAKLHEETAKWQHGVLARGVWFKAFMETKPEEATRFSVRTDTMSIHEPIKNKKPSNGWVYCLIVSLASLLGYVLHTETEMSVIEQVFYPVLSFVIMQTMYVPVRNKRKASFERRVLDDIDCQLDDMRQELEQLVASD